MASEPFPLLPLDYGTSSPLKFELVLMLIFLNLSWKHFFLKRHMTFSFIIFVFVFFPFLDVYAINFPICTVVWQPLKMTFSPWQLHVDYSLLLLDCSTTRFLTTILISFSSAIRFFMSISIFLVYASNMFITLGYLAWV